MGPVEVMTVQALADVATRGLMQGRAVRHSEQHSEQLQCALDTRIVIEDPSSLPVLTVGRPI
jgi:hypothetical protein